MKFFKNIKYLFFVAIFLINSKIAFASISYVDVTKDHWAYTSITEMAEKGFIVGNISGEYKPNNPIDKFETAKILAITSGYKYIDIKEEEKDFYNQAYNKYKKVLEKYRNKFSRWNTTADREISYLLEKKILIEEDLDHFIILNEKKQEQLRALSRQEAAVFITKLINKTNDAINDKHDKLFNDDKVIDEKNKPYVYFLKKLGVVSGDNNNFIPNGAVTKASFAVMLDKALRLKDKDFNSDILIETIVGKVESLYPSIKSIQILLNNGKSKLYKVNPNANIYLDNNIISYENIKQDMTVICTLSNNEIIDIRAKVVKLDFEKDTEIKENKDIKNNIDTEIKEDEDYNNIQGIVSYISTKNNKNYIGIEMKMVNLVGGIVNQTTKYILDENAKIYKGNKNIKFSDIDKSSIVKAKVSYDKIYSIEILEKNIKLQGRVKEKGKNEISGEEYYVISDEKGNDYEFNILNTTILERQGLGKVSWDKIKIGDVVDVIGEYTNLIELYAYGNKSSVEGIVEEIYMKQNLMYIKIKNLNGSLETFYITNKNLDITDIKLGNKVKLNLDSQEIESIYNIKDMSNYYIKGRLKSISENKIIVEDIIDGKLKTIYFDTNLNIIDPNSYKKVYIDDLKYGMIVYIYLDNISYLYTKNITILSN